MIVGKTSGPTTGEPQHGKRAQIYQNFGFLRCKQQVVGTERTGQQSLVTESHVAAVEVAKMTDTSRRTRLTMQVSK